MPQQAKITQQPQTQRRRMSDQLKFKLWEWAEWGSKIILTAIAALLPVKARRWWQGAGIGYEAALVSTNLLLGAGFRF